MEHCGIYREGLVIVLRLGVHPCEQQGTAVDRLAEETGCGRGLPGKGDVYKRQGPYQVLAGQMAYAR